jgi:hypothetical protein
LQTSERVVLVFSVNMSSHFQGYARMSSPIGRRRANIWSEANEGANPWGGTFRVEWLRLHDLPFQKTVHLKNPLNAFKPVKISRDCQVSSSYSLTLVKYLQDLYIDNGACQGNFLNHIIGFSSLNVGHCRSLHKLLVRHCVL